MGREDEEVVPGGSGVGVKMVHQGFFNAFSDNLFQQMLNTRTWV